MAERAGLLYEAACPDDDPDAEPEVGRECPASPKVVVAATGRRGWGLIGLTG
ncbi:hypothetical protein [Streptomyces sp. NPDC058964]|uniref:hypothetical protein n=1 Tax=Streptomyces sp. NPDC058964 TaxID=3346681 RepID=UPI0036BA17FC